MKKLLITGAHGFVGKHLVKRFKHEMSFQLLTPTRTELDLLDRADINYYLKHNKPNIVIHLAAQCAGIGGNQLTPGDFIYNNTLMSANIIDACKGKIDRFIGIGSICMYPQFTPVPFKEEDIYNGYPEPTNAPYGLSKRFQLEMLQAYRKQYHFPGIFLVPVNLMGEHDNFDDVTSHVVPAMLKKFFRAKLNGDHFVTLWGDGSASREFLYAGDFADAIVLALHKYYKGDPINIGTGKEITIAELATKVSDLVGFKGEILWDTSRPNGQPRRQLDVTKAKQEFGFEAQTNFDDALEYTYEWALKNNVL